MRITGTSDYANTNIQRKPNNELGQQQFLKLLTTELQYQDPLSPMDQKDFIAQLAQFSALEAMNAVRSELNQVMATNMMGKQVMVELEDKQQVQGVVDSVKLGSKNQVEVNGNLYDLAQVKQVLAPEEKSNPQLSQLNDEIKQLKALQMLGKVNTQGNQLQSLLLTEPIVLSDASGQAYQLNEILELWLNQQDVSTEEGGTNE